MLPKVRPAIAADAMQMGALHVAASRRVYAGLVPDRTLDAITPAERARRWAESLAAARPDDGIFVSEANASIVGLGHCGPQRTRTLPFPGEFFLSLCRSRYTASGYRNRPYDRDGALSYRARHGWGKLVGRARQFRGAAFLRSARGHDLCRKAGGARGFRAS